MKEIEEILKKSGNKQIEVPEKIKYRVKYTLDNKTKNRKIHFFRKFVTAIASLMIVFVGGVSTYAAFGGTIAGKPVIEWLGVKFSDEYENYIEEAKEDQKVSYENTEITLLSTMCDEGYTVLEFDVKLSKKDREYLRLDESIITEEDIKQAETEGWGYEFYEKNAKLKNTVEILFNYMEEDSINDAKKIILNGKENYVRTLSTQTTTKISDYEYKVYQIYFLTEEELGNKTNFNLTFKDIALTNGNQEKPDDESTMFLINTPNNQRFIEIDGQISVDLSKEKSLKNTRKISLDKEVFKYKNMTKTLKEITYTPMQTIIRIDSILKNVSLNSISNTSSKDYIGVMNYKYYDENGNKLTAFDSEYKRVITYANGKTEEWARGDIQAGNNFYGATMELKEFIAIETNKDMKKLIVVPVETQVINGEEQYIELDKIEIDLIDNY